MKARWLVHGLKFVAFAAVAVAALGYVVMSLWNWLVPALFAGAAVIGFWQAIGLLVLCRILVGGLRGRGMHGMHWRHRMRERWEQMTPEEREKFRAGMHGRCGHHAPPTEAT
jgi:hypothetical protein